MTVDWDSATFLRGLGSALGEVEEIGKDTAREVASTATDRMRSTVPVDTGNTKRSINFRTRRDAEGEFVEFGPGSPIARFIEYGTEHQPARPFIRPAIEQAIADEWPR